MTDFNDDDDGLPSANASGVVSDDMIKYLRDTFPKKGDDLDGDIDAGMKSWLDDKFNRQKS